MLRSSFMINLGVPVLLLLFGVLFSCGSAQQSRLQGRHSLALGEYAEAAAHFSKAYRRTSPKSRLERAELAFSMGDSYQRYGAVARAYAAYRSAERLGCVESVLPLRLAECAMEMGEYDRAEGLLRTYLKQNPEDLHAQTLLSSAVYASVSAKQSSVYVVKIANVLNSNRSDFCPCLLGEGKGQQIYFSSTRTSATGNTLSGVTGQKNADLFYSERDEHGAWKSPTSVLGGINSPSDEGAIGFSPDGKYLYLTYCPEHPTYPRGAEIWFSERSDATWSKPKVLTLSRDTLSSYAHPAVSPDGKWLYFVSDMPGGEGGWDLWRASLSSPTNVASIENLGKSINTVGDEKFPAFDAKGQLYFSSDGREGLGGLDLYCAAYDSLQQQWKITHLPAPMNSKADDFGITFDADHPRGYFSSSRSTGGRGWDKIYEFSYPDLQPSVKGWVYEQDGYELPNAMIQMVGSDGSNLKFPVKTDGSFTQKMKWGVDYLFLASCKGYLNYPVQLHCDSIQSEELVLQFPLASLSIPVLVRNVFYEFDKATITPASSAALDRLAQLLTENSHITIELAAHTDQRGSDAYNKELSSRRAENVVAYLRSKGIAADRMTAVGYGESQPKIVNKRLSETHPFLHVGDTLTAEFISKLSADLQDSCHALNRRTEFRVLRSTYGLFDADGRLRTAITPAPVKQVLPPKEEEYEPSN